MAGGTATRLDTLLQEERKGLSLVNSREFLSLVINSEI
jgi:hypothetical protein